MGFRVSTRFFAFGAQALGDFGEGPSKWRAEAPTKPEHALTSRGPCNFGLCRRRPVLRQGATIAFSGFLVLGTPMPPRGSAAQPMHHGAFRHLSRHGRKRRLLDVGFGERHMWLCFREQGQGMVQLQMAQESHAGIG